MAQHFDAVVVGLGGVGSFALRALAKERSGGRFLGLEQGSLLSLTSSASTAPPSAAGYSSQGRTRIYRRAYFEHVQYVPWIDHSLKVFRELQETSGVSLIQECGTLLIEPSVNGQNSTTTMPPLLASSWKSAQEHSIPVEYLHSNELAERFPQFHLPPNMVGLLEHGGGFLRPERIMKAALQDAISLKGHSVGANTNPVVTIWEETSVVRWTTNSSDGRIELHLRDTSEQGKEQCTFVTTDKLLVSMGAWTPQLIPSWKHMLHPVRQLQGWIDTKGIPTSDVKNNPFSCRNMPTFIYVSPDLPVSLYGFPCDDDDANSVEHDSQRESTWLKVGMHKTRYSDQFSFESNQSTSSSAEIRETQEAITHCINRSAWGGTETDEGLLPSLVETKPCLYTMTPDAHFVIGESNPNVFAVAGLSGHGYKMTPALGQMMADYAMGKDVSALWQTEFCSPHRFAT